jgi:hypothetical protein
VIDVSRCWHFGRFVRKQRDGLLFFLERRERRKERKDNCWILIHLNLLMECPLAIPLKNIIVSNF